MLTNDERIEAMYRRAQEMETENRIHRTRTMQTVCAAFGFLLVVALASFMPVLSDKIAPHSTDFNMNGSILSGNGMLGYIVIGIIAISVILEDARRDIPVQYASRIAGRTSVGNGASVIGGISCDRDCCKYNTADNNRSMLRYRIVQCSQN